MKKFLGVIIAIIAGTLAGVATDCVLQLILNGSVSLKDIKLAQILLIVTTVAVLLAAKNWNTKK